FEKTVNDFGKIDILINNAWPRTDDWGARFEKIKADSLYKNLCDHAGGYFLCCQHAANYMKKQKEGVILNMGSIYGVVGPHFPIYENTDMTCPAAYSLIKGGIHTFTKYLATYLAPYNVRVNCMAPGGIADNTRQESDFVEKYNKNTPLGRMGKPEDLIGPTIFLISDASRYVTGEVLVVDGGWTAW
ncbi:MAG TPA: SDR family oxidoreductase, partial [Nitrospirae bacterium]|nr:SDR family oxidoreductase [Nitrospirota bacterium]